jgi:patatin-related protein
MPSDSQHTQEIRFAIVLYGRVSLAIYINGVVQELLRLVRSTALPQSQLKFSEKVYRELGSILQHGVIPSPDAAGDHNVRTKFKVDVISGTSAGGINGVFLAKALANNSNIDALQDLWFDEGGIEKLLNDGQSYEGVGNRPPETDSLLNGRRMYKKLLDAFESRWRRSERNHKIAARRGNRSVRDDYRYRRCSGAYSASRQCCFRTTLPECVSFSLPRARHQ